MAGVIDSFFISLGFKPETSGLKDFQRKTEAARDQILSIGTALTAFATGFAVKEIAKIGSDFEQTRIQIAGFFTALGQSADFNAALGDADEALQMIASAAAKLPGEAEEYQQVFTDTFSFVKGAVGGSIQEMTDFTNTLTAIGKAGRLDAGQIARETDELLSAGKGRAATRNRLWMQLLPLMRHLEGQAHLTSEEFNAMTETKRADLMKRAFAGLQPMLDASANSFDAMWGAMVSGAKKLVRLGTVNLFGRMKTALAGLNAMFFDADFNLTALGKEVVDSGKKIVAMIGNVVDFGVAISKWFGSSVVAAKALKGGLALLGVGLTALAFAKVAGGVGRLLAGLLDLKRLLTGGLFLAIGLVAEDLYVFSEGGDSVTGMLVERFGPAAKYISEAVLAALGAALLYVNRQVVMMAVAFVRAALAPIAPLLAMGIALAGIVILWRRFGEKGRAAMVFIGAAAGALFLLLKRSAIQMAIGLTLMNLPLILIIATLAALAAAVYYVVTRWKDFGVSTKAAIVGVTAVMGALAAAWLATQGAAIAAGIASAAAWVAAGAPIAIAIAAAGVLAVLLYELAQHWDRVTNAIWNAVDATAKFLHLSEDASGRKDIAKRRAKFDESTKGFGGGFQRHRDSNDGESTDFLKKKSKGGIAAPSQPMLLGGFDLSAMADKLKSGGSGMLDMFGTGGFDLSKLPMVNMNGLQAMGTAAAASPTVNNDVTNITVPSINVSGAEHPEATAKAVRRELERAARSTTRTGQTRGPAL